MESRPTVAYPYNAGLLDNEKGLPTDTQELYQGQKAEGPREITKC